MSMHRGRCLPFLLLALNACEPGGVLHAPAPEMATLFVALAEATTRVTSQPDAIRLRIARDDEVLIDRTVPFPAGESEVRIRVELELVDENDTVDVDVDLLAGGSVMQSGGQTVVVSRGSTTSAVIDQSRLFDPAAALRGRAIEDFALAFIVAGEGYVPLDGLLTDEWLHSGTFPTRVEIDQRKISPTNRQVATNYRNLHRARLSAEFAALRTAYETPDDGAIAEMHALAGFTYLLFAEGYCSGVPFSRIDRRGWLSDGSALTTAQVLDTAAARFHAALAGAGTSDPIRQLAHVGLARAAQNTNDQNAARVSAQQVPTEFQYFVNPSGTAPSTANALYYLNIQQRRYSLADAEGGVGLPFRAANDPRVPWGQRPPGWGFDGVTPHFDLLKYTDPDAPIVLASGTEARLIEAEVQLIGGNVAGAVGTINALRAGVGLPPIFETNVQAAMDLLYRERAFWLFATGHRIGDLRRQILYGGTSAWPTGPYPKWWAGSYGGDMSLPIPVDPETNPSGLVCLET